MEEPREAPDLEPVGRTAAQVVPVDLLLLRDVVVVVASSSEAAATRVVDLLLRDDAAAAAVASLAAVAHDCSPVEAVRGSAAVGLLLLSAPLRGAAE